MHCDAPGPSITLIAALAVAATLGGCGSPDDSAAPQGVAAPAADGRTATVERVVDGDTLVLRSGERVRLIGIDAPELARDGRPAECYAEEATRSLRTLVPPGTEVLLVADREPLDRFGRTLAYVTRRNDGIDVNATAVSRGDARTLVIRPNTARASTYSALQREARQRSAGLWGACPNAR